MSSAIASESSDELVPAEYARERYSVERERLGVALSLSGGGFRAALFHLGALTRLNELGVLSRVDTISSVSGGSILAAHLAHCVPQWPAAGTPIEHWEDSVTQPFLEFTSRNIRNEPVLARLLPWNWFRRSTAVETLARIYEQELTDLRLTDLPERPRFIFSATNIVFGVNSIFDCGDKRMGDYQAGYAPLPAWPLAKAVAASSCFPPLFNPMQLPVEPEMLKRGHYRKDDREELLKEVLVSDGGLYDNLGLEPVWKSHATLLVSDGGSVFEAEQDTGLLARLKRYVSISARQGEAVRKRWLISHYISGEMDGAYWSVGSPAAHYDGSARGYSKELVDEYISEIRTDLDRFSAAEQRVLMNHGYLLAEAGIKRHAPALISIDHPLRVPYEGNEMSEAWVSEALRSSAKRRMFGH